MLPLYLETPHKKKTLLDILCISIQGLTKYSSTERKVLFVLEKVVKKLLIFFASFEIFNIT